MFCLSEVVEPESGAIEEVEARVANDLQYMRSEYRVDVRLYVGGKNMDIAQGTYHESPIIPTGSIIPGAL